MVFTKKRMRLELNMTETVFPSSASNHSNITMIKHRSIRDFGIFRIIARQSKKSEQ